MEDAVKKVAEEMITKMDDPKNDYNYYTDDMF